MKQLANPGELDQLVTLYHRTLTPDGMGGSTASLTAYASDIWAKVVPMTGAERERSMRTEQTVMYNVVIRNRTDVAPTDVVGWNSRQMNIRSIMDRGERHLYLQLECELGARI